MKLTRFTFTLSAATFAALTTLSLLGCGGGGTPDTNPTPSPGSLRGKVVYQYRDTSGAVSVGNVHVVNLDGTGDVTLAVGARPVLSPDGSRAYFVFPEFRNAGDPVNLYSINVDGTGKAKVSDDDSAVVGGSLSRDGNTFIFRSGKGSTEFGNVLLYAMNADGTNVRKLPFDQGLYGGKPQLSPDGSKFVCGVGSRFFVANLDGTGKVDLGLGSDPTWTSDGTKIAFTDQQPFVPTRVAMINPDGTGKQPLPGTLDGDAEPSFTVDGNYVVLRRDRNIALLKTDGTFVRRLTNLTNSGTLAFLPMAVVK